ncbi:Hypothetical protein PBC10988_24650 [Planctomycetales bacterium 10988]|nr:Hypothetical protein PBC10988_24650 [Planctomycetales bacterium 10988]
MRRDPRLGPQASLRFLPSRFHPEGYALDGRGEPALHLACPHCHLPVPPATMELESSPIPVLGIPGSGKTSFVTALREPWMKDFWSSFSWEGVVELPDDPLTVSKRQKQLNNVCQSELPIEEGNSVAARVVEWGRTPDEKDGELWAGIGPPGNRISLLRPLNTILNPKADTQLPPTWFTFYRDPLATSGPEMKLSQIARVKTVLFLFDPTQDQGCQSWAGQNGHPAVTETASQADRLIAWSQRMRQPGQGGPPKFSQLIVLLTKYDLWKDQFPLNEFPPCWQPQNGPPPGKFSKGTWKAISEALKKKLESEAPDLVSAVAPLAHEIYFLPWGGNALTAQPKTREAPVGWDWAWLALLSSWLPEWHRGIKN